MVIKESIKSILTQYGNKEIKAKEFVEVEILLMVINNLKTKVKVEDGWSVLTKYFLDFSTAEEDETSKMHLYLLRENYFPLSKRGKWKKLIDKYLKCSSDIRLFDMDSAGFLIKNEPRHEKEREKEYLENIEEMLQDKVIERNVAEDYVEYRSRSQSQNKFENKIYYVELKDLGGESINKLKRYKEKNLPSLNEDVDWKETFRLMGKKFKDRPAIDLKVLNKKVDFEKFVHIVGALGAGKSTFKFAYTFKAVKEDHCKIGIVESNVHNVLDTVRDLRAIGINAVPVIGEDNEFNHLINYYKHLDESELENDDIMKFLSGNCIIKSLVSDFEEVGKAPCRRLREGNIPVECKYANKCGKMHRYRAINSADVLVTTPYSLTKGRIKSFIDPYERGIYEMFHDLLDFIIVDEADGVQSILDSELMPHAKVNYGNDCIIDKANEFSKDISDNNNKLIRSDIYNFKMNVEAINNLMPLAIKVLLTFTKIQNYIQNKILTPGEIFNEIKDILSLEEQNQEFLTYLEDYLELTNINDITEENLEHPICAMVNKIESIHNAKDRFPEKEFFNEVKKIIKNKKVIIPVYDKGKTVEEAVLIEKVEFFIIIVQLDYLIRLIAKEYAELQYKYTSVVKYIDGIQMFSKKIMEFVKEPCIGTLYGYKFMFNDGVKIDMMRYAGVGRSLLEEWPHIKEHIGFKGPRVMCLSGTSHSPGSAHYDLSKAPDILLLSDKPEGKIDIKFLCKTYNDKFLRISGSRLEFKEDNLKRLTRGIIRDLKIRLEEKKKVLIIVNSYADCEAVANVLNGERDIEYAVVGREESDINNMITKENLEDFEEVTEGKDVCIVPLQIIARGYNILSKKDSNSYFSSAFFLIRPYMVPGDFKSYVQILNHNIGEVIEDINHKCFDYGERIENFRKRSFAKYNKVITLGYWKKLSDEEREIMSWFMMIPIKQAIGRMQRNGNDCEVVFCDAAFCEAVESGEEQNNKNSVFYAWHELLEKNMDNEVVKKLFNNFNSSLKKLIEDINCEYIDV